MNTLRKEDLKTGMRVIFRNGLEVVVMLDTPLGDILKNIGTQHWSYLNEYYDDLTTSLEELDIVEVYKPYWQYLLFDKIKRNDGSFDENAWKLLYKRRLY